MGHGRRSETQQKRAGRAVTQPTPEIQTKKVKAMKNSDQIPSDNTRSMPIGQRRALDRFRLVKLTPDQVITLQRNGSFWPTLKGFLPLATLPQLRQLRGCVPMSWVHNEDRQSKREYEFALSAIATPADSELLVHGLTRSRADRREHLVIREEMKRRGQFPARVKTVERRELQSRKDDLEYIIAHSTPAQLRQLDRGLEMISALKPDSTGVQKRSVKRKLDTICARFERSIFPA